MSLVPGTFRAKAVSGGLGYTKDGNPQIAVELQILDEEYSGESITWFGYFTEATEDRTMESLRVLGWKSDELDNLEGITDNEVKVVLDEEEYQGTTRLKVKWINRLGGLALKTPMTPQQAKAFAAQMKGKALSSRGGSRPAGRPATGARPTPQQRQPAPGARPAPRDPAPGPHPDDGGDDGIPF